MKHKTIISVSGYGATGSSAVIDYLKEFDCIDVLDDFEFQLIYFPDGISDLDYKLNQSCNRFYDSDVAISRFLSLCEKLDKWYEPAFHGNLLSIAKEYINDLNPVCWDGYWAYDRLNTPQEEIDSFYQKNEQIAKANRTRSFINRVFRKLRIPQLHIHPYANYSDIFRYRPMYFSVLPDNFLDATRDFLSKLVALASKKDCDIIAIDMLLPPQNPLKYYRYFKQPVKSIVVSRDPRDLYTREVNAKWPVVPHDNVDTFISWYRENMKASINIHDNSILRLCFEDMIYEYENTTQTIRNFLGIEAKHSGSIFNPQISVANTQLFSKLPVNQDDILKIEKELPEFLYDYSKHMTVHNLSTVVF